MKKIFVYLFTIGLILTLCSCGFNNEDNDKAEFSDKYLAGNQSGAGGFGEFGFWEKLPLEYRICYDGTVEIYMPTVSDYQITGYELAGTYQLKADEIDYLIESINQKKLYKLDPKEDHRVCDGESQYLTLYDKNDQVLKKCGGYMPTNKDFLSMYSAVKSTLHLEEHARIREEWISMLKKENGVREELFGNFLDNQLEAYYENGEYFLYSDISELDEDEQWLEIRFDEERAYADIDNDDELEMTLWGPYGGFFIDEIDGRLFLTAQGEGTASVLDYTCHGEEVWLVYSDTSHAGRTMRHFVKYSGEGNIVDEFDLNAEYWESENDCYDESSKFTYRNEEISMEEYEKLLTEYGLIN